MVARYESGGTIPLMRWGETVGKNLDCSVFFICRGPEGAVTIWWEGWEGTRHRARNWEERRERWSETGRTDASA